MQDMPVLSIGRGYTAEEAAAILGISTRTLNERVREGYIKPIFHAGERRYSGYSLARLLGWPLSDDPRDYLPVSDADRQELPRLILDALLEGYDKRDRFRPENGLARKAPFPDFPKQLDRRGAKPFLLNHLPRWSAAHVYIPGSP